MNSMLPWALYASEQWWLLWSEWRQGFGSYRRPQYARARAMVLYDRVLNGEI